jgi:hypothetical protein
MRKPFSVRRLRIALVSPTDIPRACAMERWEMVGGFVMRLLVLVAGSLAQFSRPKRVRRRLHRKVPYDIHEARITYKISNVLSQ